jgi:pullulanase/glycogen debranching enzyme
MSSLSGHKPAIRLYMPDADAVSLVVEGWDNPQPLKKDGNGMWHIKLRRSAKQLHGYAYHFNVAQNGHVFTIADPLAHRTQRHERAIRSYFADIHYRWRHLNFKTPPLRDIVIYETHLPALSRHHSAGVRHKSHRGTYVGAMSPFILNHLQRLNVAVEFLPLHANDQMLGQDWGYFSTSFFAMRECYAHVKHQVNKEVMEMVDAMHGRGIPVLLDVVFNHGAELWVKAWGEDVVYRKHANGDFCHGSGCGPTVRTEHPFIREMIIETLQHLVTHYRFDGFRFDLGALHDKQTMLEIDRRLPQHIYLIAEPWALGGAQWGKGDLAHDLAETRWAVWNDDFREPGRTFLMGIGDHHNRDRLMSAITGNHVRYGGWTLRPQQCINYLTCHDGKTLADYVENDKKRAFLGILMVLTAQGVPMLGEGSELMFSKQGHDNSYDRPDLNQIDWRNAQLHEDLIEAVAQLIALRKRFPHFHYPRHLRWRHGKSFFWDIDWIFPTGHPHNDNVNAIGFVLKQPPTRFRWRRLRDALVILLNGSDRAANFRLPKGKWTMLVDGNAIVVKQDGIRDVAPAQGDYHVHAGTGVVLAMR